MSSSRGSGKGTITSSGESGRKSPLDEKKHEPKPRVNTNHNFFKQQRKMNYQNYIHTKKHEKTLLKQNRAAVVIQSAFRGWLVRTNMVVLNKCAIKIQALWRRAIARMRYVKLYNERKERLHQNMLNKMATKIQALFRGYMSRKYRFDFQEYKKITEKNKGLEKSIERINELEEALSTGSGDLSFDGSETTLNSIESTQSISDLKNLSAVDALSAAVRSLEQILDKNSLEDLDSVSPSRLIELYSQLSLDAGESRKGSRSRAGSKPGTEGTKNSGSIDEAFERKRRSSDPLEDMFPDLPEKEGITKPDSEKTELLKHAIRLLHQKICTREIENFYKIHFLMRTTVIPGVYSDIYSNQLTEIEKKLKGLKYWDISRRSPSHPVRQKGQGDSPTQQSEEEEERMLQKLYQFKINYFLPVEELQVSPEVKMLKSSISLPAWKR